MNSDIKLVGERVGGRYALSPMMVAVSMPFFVAGFVATESIGDRPGTWYLYALVGLIAHLILWAVFAIASVTVLRGHIDNPKPLWVTLSVYLVAGEARLAALIAGIDFLGLYNPIPLWVRIVNSAVLFPVAYGFASYSLESFRRYLDTRRDLVRSIVQAEVELDHQRGAVNSLRDSFLGGIDQKISDANRQTLVALDGLEQGIRDGIDAKPELQTLLDEADRRWRGISHDTWQGAKITVPKVSAIEFLDVLAGSRPLSYVAVAIGGVFIFTLALGRQLPLVEGFLWSLLWLVATLGLAFLANTAGHRLARYSVPAFFSFYGVVVTSGVWMMWIPGIPVAVGLAAFVIHLTVVGTALLVGYGPALSKNNDAALSALRRHLDGASIDRLKVESELVVLAQKVASRLHAENRGAFMAKVLNLQKNLDLGDSHRAIADLEELRQLLQAGATRGEVPEDDDLLKFLANWRGLIEIDSNLHVASVPDELHPSINTIVMDAVNDAVRHGGADWVEINLDDSSDHVVLTIRNNGNPPPDFRATGVGAKTLDQLATGGWSREVDVLGFTRLRAEFRRP